ncbi:hypothetical protein JCM10212_002658 [Sporobolomyces blumeae]
MVLELERFVGPQPPEHLHCPVCLNALDRNKVLCKEEHAVCGACYGDMHQAGLAVACPFCADEVDPANVKSSKVIARALDQYRLKCQYEECPWIGVASDEPDHEKQCAHRPPQCTACQEFFPQFRQVPADHRRTCPELVVACAFGGLHCGGPNRGTFKVKDVESHRQVCTNIPCPVDKNCKMRTGLASVGVHRQYCLARRANARMMASSMRAMMSTFERVSKENQNLRRHVLLAEARHAQVVPPRPARRIFEIRSKRKERNHNVLQAVAGPSRPRDSREGAPSPAATI